MKLYVALSVTAILWAGQCFAITDSDSSKIEAQLAHHDLAVVEVARPGCPVCLKMYPVIERFERANPTTPLYRILVSDEGFKEKFQVSSIPAFLVFKKGKLSHAFAGLMDNDQFYQSVYFAPVAVRDPASVLIGVRELMGAEIPDELSLVKVEGGFYSVMDKECKTGYCRVFLDGTVLDINGVMVGKVYTPVPPGSCCQGK